MMNNYRCNGCGFELRRPAQPYRCPNCNRQEVGLFRKVEGTPSPVAASPAPVAGPPAAPLAPLPPAAPPAPAPPVRAPVQAAPPAPVAPVVVRPAPAAVKPPASAVPPPLPEAPPVQTPVKAAPAGTMSGAAAGATSGAAAGATSGGAAPPPLPPQLPSDAPTGRKTASPPVRSRPAASPVRRDEIDARGEEEVERPLRAGSPAAAPRSGGETAKAAARRPAQTAPVEPPVAPKPVAIRPRQFVWAYPPEPPYQPRIMPLRQAPAVDASGRLYVHVLGRLTALTEEQGRAAVAWEHVVGSPAPGPVVLGPDGRLRLHAADGFLHVVGLDGKQIHGPALVGEPLGWAAPRVDPAGNTWISAYEGGLIQVEPDGRVPRSPFFRSRQRLDCAGVIRGNVLYTGSEDGLVFAIELGGRHGANRWDHAAGKGVTGWFINAPVAMTADTLIVAAMDEHLYGFSFEGELAWRAKLPGQITGAPVVDAAGHIYVGITQSRRGQEPQGGLVCIDGNSHQVRWEYRAGAVESTPVIGDDGMLYCGDNAGLIHAVDSQGHAAWTAQVEAAVRSAGVIIAPHRLAFGLDNETLVVLECSSNALAAGWPKALGTRDQSGSVG